ncbi:alpha/beta fold hydrolase [Phytohabitans rumicis]|uniref:alpha/beta fold hydrolase n=1 Tax=Phytohabitans rumicis TaxID=1076125 RepID=UPI0015648284|nr:alpha/beta fold hydrolase [Phytohabitans rumicis]
MPLDRRGSLPGQLRLRVAVADNAAAPRGTLLLLTGGPGQPGPGLLPRLRQRFSFLMNEYRLVLIDQRGTGEGAIDCPRLQVEVGSSDITPPSADAIRECARTLGRTRHHYTTADTVADLEDLRRALGVPRWTLDGVSYGTFTAQRYGLTFPGGCAGWCSTPWSRRTTRTRCTWPACAAPPLSCARRARNRTAASTRRRHSPVSCAATATASASSTWSSSPASSTRS